MSQIDQLPDSFLRLGKSWILPPFIAYLFAILGLGPGALFVPVVIARAPLGVISYFDKVTLDDPQHGTEILLIHLVFWALLITGFASRLVLPLWALRLIWWSLVVLLFMSVSGCSHQFGAGLRSPGNWH